MSKLPFEDKRASQLLSRVGDDLSSLRNDVKMLVNHAKRHTLPDGARELARSGRNQLLSSRDYAADRVRYIGRSAREHPAGVSMAGVLLLGAVAAGIYYLMKGEGCCASSRHEREDEFEDELEKGGEY
ncbi:hypothetical protein ACFQY0_05270 [Haloferula chungangensis]|uniref:DUF3618 domain-containing protein n=1 Tax=Haloferula chungangensis TaxID=1048331 RepID=A0ABW2L4Q9_9BACT